MTVAEQWPKIKQIVGQALDLEASARAAFLDQACPHDAEFRNEVESLLAAYPEADAFSRQTWSALLSSTAETPQTIGRFRLERELGAGGMGQVWLAEQTEPVQRWIALKLIRAGMYDSTMVQRLLSERQALALMNHPAIAKVFDAGTTDTGQPYFAMEYVDGLPLNTYCDEKKLTLPERLRLFLQVCEGVQHAHQKAIIHRDLKPSNILVVEVDGKPAPRIIDFGLAKKVSPAAVSRTLLTQAGSFLGTPGYMSPEQADPNVEDIDTRTDVYSLGVILYELLTGFLPFDTQRWRSRRLDEVLREIRDTDPQRPSAKVSASKTTQATRGMEAKQLARLLRGDLDWITMRALERERDRRYGTPFALASDIERYLDHRPVVARPASPGYRFRKYIRRNRWAVLAGTLAALLLIAFAANQSIQLRRIQRERDRADRVTKFMTGMFRVADPNQARGSTITAREILDKAVKEIGTQLTEDPVMKAQMLQVMGTVYQHLGLYSQAESLFRRAIDIDKAALGKEDPDTVIAMASLGHNVAQLGRLREAERMQRELLPLEIRVLGPDHRITLKAQSDLAWTLESEGKYKESETLARGAFNRQQQLFGSGDPATLASMRTLAYTLSSLARYTEAEKLEREGLAIRQRVLGPDNPETLLTMEEIAMLLHARGSEQEAEQLLRKTLALQQRVLGPDHQNVATTMNSLGIVLQHEHQYSEAAGLFTNSARSSAGRSDLLTAGVSWRKQIWPP